MTISINHISIGTRFGGSASAHVQNVIEDDIQAGDQFPLGASLYAERVE